ncbi:MAG: acyltransferase [Asgard group archaeon]|nr:acyltransferase [Asgard group archaeon]
MKVGFIQFNPAFGEVTRNLERSVELIREGAEADLLVLPELCTTGYLFVDKKELQKLGEKVPEGPSTKAWIEVAKETNTYIVAGICEKVTNSEFYNSAVLIGPDGFVDVYRKIHLFNDEKDFFTAGNGPFKIYDLGLAKIGIMVCFDWYFPEMARILALLGADIICHPANLVLPFSQKTMLARSIENRIFTITANRVGSDVRSNKSLTFTGQSQVTSPKMALLAQASEDEEVVKVVEIDPSIASNKMITAKNHAFMDRRIDLYSPLMKKDIKKS